MSLVELTSNLYRLSAIILSADSAADRLSSPTALVSSTQQAEEVAQTLEDLKIIRSAAHLPARPNLPS
jgi:hypothetical protein